MRRIFGPVLILIARWLMLPQLFLLFWLLFTDTIGIAAAPHFTTELMIDTAVGLVIGAIGVYLSIVGFRKGAPLLPPS